MLTTFDYSLLLFPVSLYENPRNASNVNSVVEAQKRSSQPL